MTPSPVVRNKLTHLLAVMTKASLFLFVWVACAIDPALAGPLYEEHAVGNGWQWFTDYAFFSSNWTFNVEPECPVEVGTGLMMFGRPLGGSHRFMRFYQVTVYGIGALHVRSVNQGQTCNVRLDMGDVSQITIYGSPSLLQGVLDAAKRAAAAQKNASENQMPASQ
jgi:hypothetical protein